MTVPVELADAVALVRREVADLHGDLTVPVVWQPVLTAADRPGYDTSPPTSAPSPPPLRTSADSASCLGWPCNG
jgi:hypothetical protein